MIQGITYPKMKFKQIFSLYFQIFFLNQGYKDHVSENEKQIRLEKVIDKHTKARNENFINNIEEVLVEKDSKRSDKQWAGRTDSNKWVIFDKNTEKIGDFVPVALIQLTELRSKDQ